MKPKIAVIVPVYKAEKFIGEGLECLLNQTLKDIKVVCVNDASPDNSLAIIQDYAKKDDRVVVLNHEQNLGASQSRNDGLDYVCQNLPDVEYVAFFDADDKIELDAYEKCYNEAKEHNADIVNFNFLPSSYWKYKTEANGEVVEYENNCIESIFDYQEFYTFIVCWSKIYKKELVENVRFPKQKFFEDGGFAYKVLPRAKKLRVIPDTLYQYNIENSDSVCGKIDELNRLKDIFKTMKDTLVDWQQLGIADKYKYQYVKHILLYTSLVCPNVLEGDYSRDLSENLQISVPEEISANNVPEETKLILRKMNSKK